MARRSALERADAEARDRRSAERAAALRGALAGMREAS
jgi:hypothetical protein